MWGYLGGTDSYFRDSGWSGTESHWGIGGPADGSSKDGLIYQWVPCDRKADANLDGNWHVLSIETSDGAKGPPPWTEKQLDSIVKICVWACQRYNIPAELIPDTKPGRRGIGYHRQGIDNWRVEGGEKWSNSTGKVCPGDERVAQMADLVNRIRAELGQTPTTPPATTPPPSTTTGGGDTGTFTIDFEGGSTMSLRVFKKTSPLMSGTDVKSVQTLVNARGYSPGSIDGYYGDDSVSAIKKFQSAKGLTSDGVVGSKTFERLVEG
jgi:hypothetical protein